MPTHDCTCILVVCCVLGGLLRRERWMLVYRQNRHRKTSMFCMGLARLSLEEDFLGSADAALALEGPRSTVKFPIPNVKFGLRADGVWMVTTVPRTMFFFESSFFLVCHTIFLPCGPPVLWLVPAPPPRNARSLLVSIRIVFFFFFFFFLSIFIFSILYRAFMNFQHFT